MESPGRYGDWLAPPPSPPRGSRSQSIRPARGKDFYLATSGDLYLATSRDIFMATDRTAAYRRQLRVAAVARPVRGGVGALGVLAVERSWWLLAQTAAAQRSVQPLSRGRALSPWSTRPAGTPRRRSPVSTH